MSAPPPSKIPDELYDEYTLNKLIPVYDWYIDNRFSKTLKWTDEYVNNFIKKYTMENILANKEITEGPEKEPYPQGSLINLMAIMKYKKFVEGRSIAVIGSLTPWLEAIILNCGAKSVTTVEYNKPDETSKIKTITYDDFVASDTQYDSIFSYSSIEHSGLGRYGDPLKPNGDIETVKHIYAKLRKNGMFFLGLPVGRDAIVWNAHRVYGPIRLTLLTKDFVELGWFGVEKKYIYECAPAKNGPQPVIVYQKRA